MKLEAAFAYFCDDNDLKRIDATPEDRLVNLARMEAAIHKARLAAIAEIESRCPHCKGTGKR